MTFQRTVLFTIAGLIVSVNANAQCPQARRVVTTLPWNHHHLSYVRSHVTLHPQYRQTAELPPAPSSIVYGGLTRTEELAAQLEILMNELCLDLYYNYSHNPNFQATYAEAYSLFQAAQYIHASEQNCDRETVAQRLGGADALLHHIENDVRGWTRISRRQIGSLGVVTKIEQAVDTLHCLMEDVGITLNNGLEVPPALGVLEIPPAPIR